LLAAAVAVAVIVVTAAVSIDGLTGVLVVVGVVSLRAALKEEPLQVQRDLKKG